MFVEKLELPNAFTFNSFRMIFLYFIALDTGISVEFVFITPLLPLLINNFPFFLLCGLSLFNLSSFSTHMTIQYIMRLNQVSLRSNYLISQSIQNQTTSNAFTKHCELRDQQFQALALSTTFD